MIITLFFISSKNCDLTNYERTRELFERLRPKYVIHLFANVGGLFKNMNPKLKCMKSIH